MSACSSSALQEQLRVIMSALTNAAVTEVCALLDGGYAALRRELSRARHENQDLKKKLHLIQSIVVRGGSGAPEPEVRSTEEGGGGGGDGGGGDGGGGGGGGGGDVTVVLREELPEVVLIKDEDSDSEDGSKAPAVTSPPVRAKRLRRGGEAADRKWSSEQLPVKASRLTGSVYMLESPGGSGQHGAEQAEAGGGQAEAGGGEPLCSYSSLMDPDLQLVPPRQPACFGALMESPPSRAELDLSPMWTRQAQGHAAFTPFHHSEAADGDAFGIRLVSVSGSASTDSQLSEGSGSAPEYDGGDVTSYGLVRGRRLACSVCGRTYATAQNLEVHMRIHTGQRPFSCQQCGKTFTQSCHLKSHLNIHSGERPHACPLCPRSFMVKYSLKLHVKKCHPDAPGP